MSIKFYAGIGSRKTPNNILNMMRDIATRLEKEGWFLNSGGAVGADTAFHQGAGTTFQLFYVNYWLSGYQRNWYQTELWEKAENIAKDSHPAWNRCSPYARKLHTRNAFQVLGNDLISPVTMVICWTPDGAQHGSETSIHTGGTGTAIRIASRYNIPVWNLNNAESYARILGWLNSAEFSND